MTEILQRIAAFFDILSTQNVLIEIGAVALCLAAGWFVGTALRDRYERRRQRGARGVGDRHHTVECVGRARQAPWVGLWGSAGGVVGLRGPDL